MILLDTHVLLWATTNDKKLGRKTRSLINRKWQTAEVGVCTLTFWEIATLQARGRIVLPVTAREWRDQRLDDGLVELPLNGAMAIHAAELSSLPGDPADRLIAATAIGNSAELVTADARILQWPHSLVRHDASR